MGLNQATQTIKQYISGLAILLPLSVLALNSQVKAETNDKFIPFFDTKNNPVPVAFPPGKKLDISPPAPRLNSFDKDVLRICGPMGTRVRPYKFKQLLSYYPDVVQKLQKATGGELRPNRRRKSEFIQDLTNIWFRRKGFEHIFCGEIYNVNDIGGLHFYGRYLELQNKGIGGRLPNNSRREEVVPGVIYTMGVILKQNNRIVRDVIKGYTYVSDAQEMLIDATRIFKLQGNTEGACIFKVRDRETGKTFPAVFVRRNQGIITYYPDATPKGRQCKQ